MRVGFVQIVFFIFSLSIMFAAVYGAFRIWRSNPRASQIRATETRTSKTSGEVIALKAVRRWTVAPQVRFLASDGRVVTFVDKIEVNISIPTYKIGQTVTVTYQPDKPENARVGDASVGGLSSPYAMPCVLLLIGFGFALGATFSRDPGNVSIFDYVRAAASPSRIHVHRMTGNWANEDTTGWANPDTALTDITRIQIDVDWPRVKATMWSKCRPRDCAPNRSESPRETSYSYIHQSVLAGVLHLNSRYSASDVVTLRMQLRPDGRLEVETTTRLTDKSGRKEFSRTYYFRRQ